MNKAGAFTLTCLLPLLAACSNTQPSFSGLSTSQGGPSDPSPSATSSPTPTPSPTPSVTPSPSPSATTTPPPVATTQTTLRCKFYDLSGYYYAQAQLPPTNNPGSTLNFPPPSSSGGGNLSVPLSGGSGQAPAQTMPNDYSTLIPAGSFEMDNFDVSPISSASTFPGAPRSVSSTNNFYGVSCRGQIYVPEPRTYAFYLSAQTGARLFIDGKKIVDYDGPTHPTAQGTGGATLTNGIHLIRMDWYQLQSPQISLVLAWDYFGCPTGVAPGSASCPLEGGSIGPVSGYIPGPFTVIAPHYFMFHRHVGLASPPFSSDQAGSVFEQWNDSL